MAHQYSGQSNHWLLSSRYCQPMFLKSICLSLNVSPSSFPYDKILKLGFFILFWWIYKSGCSIAYAFEKYLSLQDVIWHLNIVLLELTSTTLYALYLVFRKHYDSDDWRTKYLPCWINFLVQEKKIMWEYFPSKSTKRTLNCNF